MSIYLFRNPSTGLEFEIVRPMKDAPPISIVLDGQSEGGWRAVAESDGSESVYHRVFSHVSGVVKNRHRGATHYEREALPVSRSLPRATADEIAGAANRQGHDVLELKDGTHATMDGLRIVDGHEAAAKHCEATGFVRDDFG